MIDFSKITNVELGELKKIAVKAAEKSDFEKYFLFTNDPIEKARLFIYGNRFLINIYNLIDECDLRTAIKGEIDNNKDRYKEILFAIKEIDDDVSYGTDDYIQRVFELVNKDNVVDGLADLFSVLIEKANIIQVSKLKGILLEGKSGEEYKRTFKPVSDS